MIYQPKMTRGPASRPNVQRGPPFEETEMQRAALHRQAQDRDLLLFTEYDRQVGLDDAGNTINAIRFGAQVPPRCIRPA